MNCLRACVDRPISDPFAVVVGSVCTGVCHTRLFMRLSGLFAATLHRAMRDWRQQRMLVR